MSNLVTWADMQYLISPEIADEVSQLPDVSVKSILQRAAAEVAKETTKEKQVVTMHLQAGVEEYPLEITDGQVVLGISALHINNNRVKPNLKNYRLDFGGWIRIAPHLIGCDSCATVICVTAPGPESCGVSKEFFSIADNAIATYAMYLIHLIDGSKYTSTGATMKMREYKRLISRIKSGSSASNISSVRRTRSACKGIKRKY